MLIRLLSPDRRVWSSSVGASPVHRPPSMLPSAGIHPVILERRPAPVTHTTAASTGAFRLQFDNREEMESGPRDGGVAR